MKLVKEISSNNYKLITSDELSANPNLYIDRTGNPIYWVKYYEEVGISYFKMRLYVQEQVDLKTNGFDDFRDPDKDVLGILYIGTSAQIIAFYMGYYGYDQTTASMFHVDRLALNLTKKSNDTRIIAASPKIISVGIKYLTWVNSGDGTLNTEQANNFTSAIQGFLTEYERYALLGLNYGDDREGIMDYVESTNNYSSGGLKNYIFNPDLVAAYGGDEDLVRLAMAAELKDVFVNGNI